VDWPLAQFQAARFNQTEIFQLFKTINASAGLPRLPCALFKALIHRHLGPARTAGLFLFPSATERTAPRPDCLAGHVRFELRNVIANYPFEKSRRFAGNQPNSGHGDHSRLSCGAGDTQRTMDIYLMSPPTGNEL